MKRPATRRAAAAGLLLALLLMAASTESTAPDTTAVDRLLERQMRLSRIPGAALLIVDRHGEVHAAAFSLDGARLSADSVFFIGSVTKTFTALAVAQLADAGRMRFDDPVATHLPGLILRDPEAARAITLRHLLTHTSGLSQWHGHDRRAQREARFEHIAPRRPPGTRFEYSSLNYIILGRVIEAVSGESYGAYVERHIFEPLGMTASSADPDAGLPRGLVTGHRYLFGWPLPGTHPRPPVPLVPAGFIASSARDLGRYLTMLLNEGSFRGRQVVSPGALREMLTPWNGEATGPGMAWGIGRTTIGHAGNTQLFSARVALLPGEQHGIALVANVNSGPFLAGTGDLMDGLIRLVRGETAAGRWPREIFAKLAILIVPAIGVVRMIVRLREWARRGYPRRVTPSGRALRPVMGEAAIAIAVLVLLPRWLGVPLLVILEYFPDLGLAMMVSVAAGLTTAVMGWLLSGAPHATRPTLPGGPR